MDIANIKQKALEEIDAAQNSGELEVIRVKYLGRAAGEINMMLRGLKDMSIEEKKEFGPALQELARNVEAALGTKSISLGTGARSSYIDVTAPGRRLKKGHLHPLTLVDREIRRIFASMNFASVEGPDVETVFHNFDALNFPPGHPARDMQDTFWIKGGPVSDTRKQQIPRTHVSAMQVRHPEKNNPPLQIIYTGRCFRYDSIDMTHETNFHQAEGMVIGKDITLANFKYVIEHFLRELLGKDIKFRYRPSYFPFTEPSVEVDVFFRGKWLEIMGAGMTHQHVYEAAHLNKGEWQGFAFGMGLDRLAMIKYNIPDVRLLTGGDLRFIHQFS